MQLLFFKRSLRTLSHILLTFNQLINKQTLCAIRNNLYNLKNVKNSRGGVILSGKVTLLKLSLPHGCFSRFLNCTNGTKLRKASNIKYLYNRPKYKEVVRRKNNLLFENFSEFRGNQKKLQNKNVHESKHTKFIKHKKEEGVAKTNLKLWEKIRQDKATLSCLQP